MERPVLMKSFGALFLVGLLFSTRLLAADWPAWRGPAGTGVSHDKGVPIVWHEGRSIIWKCPLPEWGTSTPVIAGGAVFVTTHSADDKLLLLSIDEKNGRPLWTREVGTAGPPREGPQRHPQKVTSSTAPPARRP